MPDGPVAQPAISVFGVQIRIHLSWLIVAFFIAWSLASGELPALHKGLPAGAYWLTAGLILAGITLSILMHELAHTLVGRAMGVSVDRITLFMFGGVAELRGDPKSARAELIMALAGPVFSIGLSFVLTVAGGVAEQGGAPAQATIALSYLATLNLALAIFNLAPAFPLDGGRVLRAILWMFGRDLFKATTLAVQVSKVLALALIVAGLLLLFVQGAAAGLWWMLIGLFLHGLAAGALRDLEARRMFGGHAIAELMIPNVETVPADFTLERFVEERLFGSRHGLYPVVDGETWLGVVTPEDILRTPRDSWARTTLGQVCTPAQNTPSAGLLDDASQVMDRMRELRVQRMPVVHRHSVVGIVTLEDLVESLDLWRRFGRAAA